ncbi:MULTISPECIES: hypothetical protein [Cyanophyceae]|uniref:hypothetical protein n=1 Tax=Cyanophyceae TaxID=3028117 RepID=UPI002FD659AC
MSRRLIFTRYLAVPIAHIALAVVAVFVEAIDAGNLTAADVVAVVGAAEFAEFDRLLGSPVRAGNPKSKI